MAAPSSEVKVTVIGEDGLFHPPPREPPRYKLILVGEKAAPVKTLNVTLPYWEPRTPNPDLRGRDVLSPDLRGRVVLSPDLRGRVVLSPDLRGRVVLSPDLRGRVVLSPDLRGRDAFLRAAKLRGKI